MAVEHVIFDLADVFIPGLDQAPRLLAPALGLSEKAVFAQLNCAELWVLLRGHSDEDTYLDAVMGREGWQIDRSEVKRMIRDTFRRELPGTRGVLEALAGRMDVSLHTDHVREWIAHIHTIHPFMGLFRRAFYSFEMGTTKREPESFRHVLGAIGAAPETCLFIDDRAINVETAQSVGIDTIQFSDAAVLADELARRGLL
jgi:FMN phosphatase YigB (HAD superfamily)